MTARRLPPAVGPFGSRPLHWHTRWSAANPPIGRLRSGDRLELDLPDASAGELSARSTRRDLAKIDYSRVDAAVGPFEIEGARPGDGLRVHLESIQVGPWGWSGVFRQFGFLRNRFDDDLVVWRIDRGLARPVRGFLRPLSVRIQPMLGWIGTAPRTGDHPMIPPRRTGGNMDNRLNGPGSSILLPVEVPGALLSLGDPHARMGDGEVSGTGIETPAHATIRVELVRRGAPVFPRTEVGRLPADSGPAYVASGVAGSPLRAARFALENLLDWLGDAGIPPKEGYLLASILGDLRMSEVVDLPNYVVSMTFPDPRGRIGERRRAPF